MNSIQKTETQEPTMSSREIAEITGKRHDHILRDIRKMFDDLEISSAQFWGAYKDGRGNTQPCFNLNRHYTEVLLTGYDVKRRAAVIKRWYCSGQSKPDTLLRTVFKFYRCHIIQCRMQTT
jgi:phage regulator Rha-like protein